MSKLFVVIQFLLPQHGLSRLAGWLARRQGLRTWMIRWFIRRYGVDMSESLVEDPAAFSCFNDFFTRELKPGARPSGHDGESVLCPADGSISQLGTIHDRALLQAKGRRFSLQQLLADQAMADLFANGSFATIYLSPRDYHRVHMPLAGRLRSMVYVPGRLFSVNPATTAGVDRLFARNERVVSLFDTEAGPMALVLVGAMIVASIDTVWAGQVAPCRGPRRLRRSDYLDATPPVELAAAAEMGRFRLGSTVIVLFGHGAVMLEQSLQPGAGVHMGQPLGKLRPVPQAAAGEKDHAE